MTAFEVKKERILADLEGLLTYFRTLADPPTQSSIPSSLVAEIEPFRPHMHHWKRIEAVVKDADELLTKAHFANAFASKKWLRLVLDGDPHLLLPWPIADVIRDLTFVRDMILEHVPPHREHASISKEQAEAPIKTEPNKASTQTPPVLPNEGTEQGTRGPTPEQVKAAEALVDRDPDVDVQHAAWYLRYSKKHVLRLIRQGVFIVSNTRPKRITSQSLKKYKWPEGNPRSDET